VPIGRMRLSICTTLFYPKFRLVSKYKRRFHEFKLETPGH
jgi:hypothetical protein